MLRIGRDNTKGHMSEARFCKFPRSRIFGKFGPRGQHLLTTFPGNFCEERERRPTFWIHLRSTDHAYFHTRVRKPA
jgi:hypothetical protein